MKMQASQLSIDPDEIAKFEAMARNGGIQMVNSSPCICLIHAV